MLNQDLREEKLTDTMMLRYNCVMCNDLGVICPNSGELCALFLPCFAMVCVSQII